MRVILLQDVPHLGRKNEVKEVSDGYARNFLFPKNLAKPATSETLKNLAVQKARAEKEKSEEFQKYKTLAEKLKNITLNFKVKTGGKGRAFGSVTAVKIRDALKKQGLAIEKEWILLEKPVKTTGESSVKIKLPQEISSQIKISVEAE